MYAVFGILEPKEVVKIMKRIKEKSSSSGSNKEEPPKDAKKEERGEGLKIITANQLLTRLPILLAQKKGGNNSQKLNNEIRQIVYSLYSSKNMSKTVYNHLMNSLQIMDNIFINTENSKTNESNRFRLSFTNKLDIRSKKTISLANLFILLYVGKYKIKI